jgi:hypothetical protein
MRVVHRGPSGPISRCMKTLIANLKCAFSVFCKRHFTSIESATKRTAFVGFLVHLMTLSHVDCLAWNHRMIVAVPRTWKRSLPILLYYNSVDSWCV